jgi:N-terminal region of glycosyl transferase group 7
MSLGSSLGNGFFHHYGSFSGFCRAHLYRAMLVVVACLILFEFSTMVFSEERQSWLPSYPGFLKPWSLKILDPRVVSCNDTGCWDQFGSLYQLDQSTDLLNSPHSSSSKNVTNSTLVAVSGLDLCPVMPPALVGPVKVMTKKLSDKEIVNVNPDLEPGGRFRPTDCIARYKVAIILPFRDRSEHLRK